MWRFIKKYLRIIIIVLLIFLIYIISNHESDKVEHPNHQNHPNHPSNPNEAHYPHAIDHPENLNAQMGDLFNNKYEPEVPLVNLYTMVDREPQEIRPGYSKKYILIQSTVNGLMRHLKNNAKTYDEDFFKAIKCPAINCVLTYNVSMLPNIYDFDAIFIHGTENREQTIPTIPKLRSPHQKYIMGTIEPPSLMHNDLGIDDNFYNWTMSYKINSDVLWAYGYFVDKESHITISPAEHPPWKRVEEDFYDENILNIIKNKTKKAAQFVSHCYALSRRDELTKTLQKYIEVDVYGRCGTLKCPLHKSECDELLDTDYKFYLAFENDLCNDYVTEKLFRTLTHTIIPIVYGASMYNRFAPPKSYIDANQFNTVKELAEYLIYLDENPEEYMKYFWWTKHYEIRRSLLYGFCNLCMKLNTPNAVDKTDGYNNIHKWFSSTCFSQSRIQFV